MGVVLCVSRYLKEELPWAIDKWLQVISNLRWWYTETPMYLIKSFNVPISVNYRFYHITQQFYGGWMTIQHFVLTAKRWLRGGNINNNVYNCMWSLAMYSNYCNIHFLHHGLEPCSFLLMCVYLTVSYCITIDDDCTWYPTMTKNLMLCLRYCKHSCCPCALLDAWY